MKKIANELKKIANELIAYGNPTKEENRSNRDSTVRTYAHLSKNWSKVSIKEDVNIEAYIFDEVRFAYVRDNLPRYGYLIWSGNASRPEENFYYKSKDSRDESFDDVLKNAIKVEESIKKRKEERAKERREYKHNFKVGDFLVCSWGYDQTNVDFYKVVSVVSDKTIKIQECGKRVVRSSQGSDFVVPTNSVSGPIMLKKVQNGHVKISSFSSASKWDGSPRYQTAFGYGH